MIVLCTGTDEARARNAAREYVLKARAKRPDLSYLRITPDSFDASHITEWVGSQGLFVHKLLFVLDGVLADSEARDALKGAIKEIRESENVFLFLESANTKDLSAFRNAAEKVYEFERKAVPEKTQDPWALMNAVRARNAQRAWAVYRNELAQGTPVEVLAGSVHSVLRSAVEKGNRNYPNDEAARASLSFADRYHRALSGASSLSLEEEVEAFLLCL